MRGLSKLTARWRACLQTHPVGSDGDEDTVVPGIAAIGIVVYRPAINLGDGNRRNLMEVLIEQGFEYSRGYLEATTRNPGTVRRNDPADMLSIRPVHDEFPRPFRHIAVNISP